MEKKKQRHTPNVLQRKNSKFHSSSSGEESQSTNLNQSFNLKILGTMSDAIRQMPIKEHDSPINDQNIERILCQPDLSFLTLS